MKLDRERLDDLLGELRARRGDTTTVEVKRATGGLPSDIGKSICAFANMPDGGHIVLGVSEAGGFSITGVNDPGRAEAGLASIARQTVTPSPFLETDTIDYDGVRVVTARVAALSPMDRPATYKGDAYLRQADGDYAMGPADLRMFEIAKLHETERAQYDATPVPGASSDDLDQDLVEQFLRRARRSSPRLRPLDEETLMRQMGAITPSGTPTIAGLYAMGNYPQGLLPALRVTAAVQLPRDGGGARTQNLRDFDGPLPDLLEAAMDWVVANLTTRQVYQPDGHLRGEPEMPLRAIREALANALVHRDLGPDTLGTGRSIDIRITNSALTIMSPGGLRGVTLGQITSSSHARVAVNQRLYTIAKHLRTHDGENIIEGEGGGVTEILRSTVEADLHRPRLVDNGVQFTAIIWRGSAFKDEDARWLSERGAGRSFTHLQKQILLMARDGVEWDMESLREEFSPLSREDAQVQLSQLVQWGFITADLEEDVSAKVTPRSSDGSGSPEPTEAPPSSDLEQRVARVGKNAPAVWEALSEGASISEVATATQLSTNQVRYALSGLINAGYVVMEGGQGHLQTMYRSAV